MMLTPMVDETHDVLGFIPTWIRKLAAGTDHLFVITLDSDKETDLPENVSLFSLRVKNGRLKKLIYFYKLLTGHILREKINIIFCHMYPLFTCLAGPVASILRIPIVTWYTHRAVTFQLRLAHFFASRIVTASKESFGINSSKVIITGHGIDINMFKPPEKFNDGHKKIILSVGRISPVKNYETLIEAANILTNGMGNKDLNFMVVGGMVNRESQAYHLKLKRLLETYQLEDKFTFVGPVSYKEMARCYQCCDVLVNLSPTGSFDKSVLEAMACGKPVLVCSESFIDFLGGKAEDFIFDERNPYSLSEKILLIRDMKKDAREQISVNYRRKIVEGHNINNLTIKLINIFEELKEGNRRHV